jgi:hypothetical protein
LSDISTGVLFPVPKALAYIEIKNRQTVEKLISALIGYFKVNPLTETYSSVSIHYIMMPFVGGIEPAYAFFDDFCIVSTHRQLIKDALISYENGGGLTENPAFTSINQGLTDKNNRILFIQTDKMLTTVKEMLGWGANILAIKDQAAAERTKLLVEEAVNPILGALAVCRNIGARTLVRDDEIETEIYYRFDR